MICLKTKVTTELTNALLTRYTYECLMKGKWYRLVNTYVVVT